MANDLCDKSEARLLPTKRNAGPGYFEIYRQRYQVRENASSKRARSEKVSFIQVSSVICSTFQTNAHSVEVSSLSQEEVFMQPSLTCTFSHRADPRVSGDKEAVPGMESSIPVPYFEVNSKCQSISPCSNSAGSYVNRFEQGVMEQAKAAFQKAMDDEKAANELFEMAVNIGQSLHALQRHSEALVYFQKALRFKAKTIHSEPPRIQAVFAEVLFDIGVIHSLPLSSNRIKALQAFQFCLEVRRHCFGSDHPAVASVLYHLACIYASLQQEHTAIELLEEAIAILQFECPQKSHLAEVWATLGRLQHHIGSFDDAMSSFEEAAQLLWTHRRDSPPSYAVHGIARLISSMENALRNPQHLNMANNFVFSACLWSSERDLSRIDHVQLPSNAADSA